MKFEVSQIAEAATSHLQIYLPADDAGLIGKIAVAVRSFGLNGKVGKLKGGNSLFSDGLMVRSKGYLLAIIEYELVIEFEFSRS